MTLFEQMKDERKGAMKIRDSIRSKLLGCLLAESALHSKSPSDEEVVATVKSMIKKLEETLGDAKDEEMKSQIQRELEICRIYLPEIKMVSEEELRGFIKVMIAGLANPTKKSMGEVMGAIKEEYGKTADMKLASKIVRESL